MTQPPAYGRDVYTTLDASGREQMPESMPRHSVHSSFGAGVGQRFFTFSETQNVPVLAALLAVKPARLSLDSGKQISH